MPRASRRSGAAPAPAPFSLLPQPVLRLTMPRAHALCYIRGRPTPRQQIEYHLANPGVYARDGRASGPPREMGVTTNLPRRRLQYRRCERTGLVHLWLFAFRTRNRYRLKRLSHLGFQCDSPADRLPCPSCGTIHCKYWKFSDIGCSFRALKTQCRAFVSTIGEPGTGSTIDKGDVLMGSSINKGDALIGSSVDKGDASVGSITDKGDAHQARRRATRGRGPDKGGAHQVRRRARVPAKAMHGPDKGDARTRSWPDNGDVGMGSSIDKGAVQMGSGVDKGDASVGSVTDKDGVCTRLPTNKDIAHEAQWGRG
ncbi:hypothetical protein C8F04DRAFT_1276076 [Mycena alexandri]|uniref:Uncharacterized protein n=1 Tax=Mycena alexandri TaxID=1745969 RepID=A0AAD6S232_9AGAR|nr:hypothetical protein C8F04DRAFT_1276076 [Mycena alexandri]